LAKRHRTTGSLQPERYAQWSKIICENDIDKLNLWNKISKPFWRLIMDSNEKINSIVNDLLNVRENLLSLSDDIWLNINHNNNDELQQAFNFKKEYNKLFDEFNKNALSLSALIQQYTGIGNIEAAKPVIDESSEENKKIVVQLNKEIPHSINEDFIFKRPYAFSLKGYAYKNVTTWKALFNQVCACLDRIDHNKMLKTVTADEFISPKKNLRYFSNDKTELREFNKITDSVYAEVNMSANSFVKVIKILFDFYKIPYNEIKIYLREDRNA
jgi:hypothetical protein